MCKKYTDRLTTIRNNYVKFHEIWISGSQVTVLKDRQTDGQTNAGHLYTIIRPVKIVTGVYKQDHL